MSAAFIIIFLTFVVAGALPPLVAHYILRVDFLGGTPAATIVGVIAAVMGGLVRTLFLPALPDLIVIAGAVDLVPPLLASILITTLFGLVSASNGSR